MRGRQRFWRWLTGRPIVPFDTLWLETFRESLKTHHSVSRATADALEACGAYRDLLGRIR